MIISNIPNEELIAVVMNGGAKISSEFEVRDENFKFEDVEYEIKIDETNKNKVEIFDKKFGHSISTRILDKIDLLRQLDQGFNSLRGDNWR